MLIFTKTEHGGTDQVWFYDMTADAFEQIAAELHAEGFEFVTVHELYSIYGKTLEPGKVYFSPKQ